MNESPCPTPSKRVAREPGLVNGPLVGAQGLRLWIEGSRSKTGPPIVIVQPEALLPGQQGAERGKHSASLLGSPV